MPETEFDLIILGGGNAITVGIRAAQAGRRVALVEQDRLGGTCPNRGCVPSKLLLGYAEVATTIRGAARFHLSAELLAVDAARILRETKAATLDVVDGKIAANLPDNLELIRGHGRFVADHEIEVDGRRIRGKTIVIGTGTGPRPAREPDLAASPYWTSDDVFSLTEAPKSITIVGGGFIACELATFFQGIGVTTTLVHRGPELLKNEDRDLRPVFLAGFRDQVDTRLETALASVRHEGGRFHMDLVGVDGHRIGAHESEALLLAIGRVPNTQDLGLENTNIATNGEGFIVVDDRLRTSVAGVHALGDVAGRYQFTHSAAWEANYLADCLLAGRDEDLDYGPMPHAVFSHPELAGVGATEDELVAAAIPHVAASLPYSTAAKGRAIKEEHGLCKLLLAPDGRILGCHIVGAQASLLIHQAMTAMRWRNHISTLTDMIYIHPSLAEVLRNTARKAKSALSSPA